MPGGGSTVNVAPLLVAPETVTITLPVVAPFGTRTAIVVPLQLVDVAEVPLSVTVLVPCVAPKFVPAIVTDVPTVPEVGDKLAIVGALPAPVVIDTLSNVAVAKFDGSDVLPLATPRPMKTFWAIVMVWLAPI